MNIYRLKYKPALRKAFSGFAQFHEDFYLATIFAEAGSGVCVDVGANDGFYGSNSALLESLGWQCILVEPNTRLCNEILAKRKPYRLFPCIASDSNGEDTLYVVSGGPLAHGLSTVQPSVENIERITTNNFSYEEQVVESRTLDSMLVESGVSKVDVLSIDVEGHELAVLKGTLLEKWMPRIIIVEDNSNYKSVDVLRYLQANHYTRFFRTGVNDWYARSGDKKFVNLTNLFFYSVEKFLYVSKLDLLPSFLRLVASKVLPRKIKDLLKKLAGEK